MAQIESNPAAGLNGAVAAELRAERAAMQITVDDLAERSGIPKSTLLRYLNAQRHINVDSLDQLSRALGTTSAEIVSAAVHRLDRSATTEVLERLTPAQREEVLRAEGAPIQGDPIRSRRRSG